MERIAINSPEVADVFDRYPPGPRRKLLALRRLILETAARTEGVGEIEETLKWGEPAYLTSETKSGSTLRLGWKKTEPDRVAIHFNCQTKLIGAFREMFPDEFTFVGNRSIVFDGNDSVPKKPLSFCIASALTYHRIKKSLLG